MVILGSERTYDGKRNRLLNKRLCYNHTSILYFFPLVKEKKRRVSLRCCDYKVRKNEGYLQIKK